jgi:ribosomal protein L7/L12
VSTKRERLVNALKAMTAADMVSYGLSPEESACAVKLLAAMLAAMERADGSFVTPSGERFSGRVVAELKNQRKIGAIKQYREETSTPLVVAKEAVERLEAVLGLVRPSHAGVV